MTNILHAPYKTDAAINPGNLRAINQYSWQVIGITLAKFSNNGQTSEGMILLFANDVNIIKQLEEKEK